MVLPNFLSQIQHEVFTLGHLANGLALAARSNEVKAGTSR